MHSLYYDPSCTLIVVKFFKSWIYGESTELKADIPNKVSVKGICIYIFHYSKVYVCQGQIHISVFDCIARLRCLT